MVFVAATSALVQRRNNACWASTMVEVEEWRFTLVPLGQTCTSGSYSEAATIQSLQTSVLLAAILVCTASLLVIWIRWAESGAPVVARWYVYAFAAALAASISVALPRSLSLEGPNHVVNDVGIVSTASMAAIAAVVATAVLGVIRTMVRIGRSSAQPQQTRDAIHGVL